MVAKKKVSKKSRRAVKGKSISRKSVLSGAVKDLDNEIRSLGKQKRDIKGNVGKTSSMIEMDRRTQRDLQRKISKLMDKEARLNQKKKKLQTKMDKISDNLNKISKIRSEMMDL